MAIAACPLVCSLFGPSVRASETVAYSIEIAGLTFEFVRIPAGRFVMGSDAGDGDERPLHPVEIECGFDLGKTEVTVRQFRAFVEATRYETVAERKGSLWHCASPAEMGWVRERSWRDPGFEQTDDHPVVGISYIDAIAFCRWLSQQSGEHYRLPTEAEWEYACRAGTTEAYAGAPDEMAWYDGNSGRGTHPVAQKSPNAWGLFDMHGNAAEWCEDTYDWHYGSVPRDGSAHTVPGVPAVAAARRVVRGGSWSGLPYACRSAHRCPVSPAHRGTDTGFRIVRGKERPPSQTPVPPFAVLPQDNSSRKLSLRAGGIAFDFVRVEPGTFVMGSPHHYTDEYGWVYEMARREVTIGYDFYLGTTEVTREQFHLFVDETGYVTDAEKQGWAYTCVPDAPWHYQALMDWRFPGFVQTDRDPVTHIGWHDAVAFCQWLSEKTGREIRLPSEAEWEYACRAGTTGEFAGPLDEMAWTLWNSGQVKRTRPVAQKQPNAWGFYDMHGGVWEWVQDLWHEDSSGAPTDGSAWVQTDRFDPMGITRGGSFASPPWLCRSYIRMRTPLGQMIHYNNGFRIVCTTSRGIATAREDASARTAPWTGKKPATETSSGTAGLTNSPRTCFSGCRVSAKDALTQVKECGRRTADISKGPAPTSLGTGPRWCCQVRFVVARPGGLFPTTPRMPSRAHYERRL